MYDQEVVKRIVGNLAFMLTGQDPLNALPGFLLPFLDKFALVPDQEKGSCLETAYLGANFHIDTTAGTLSAIIRLREEAKKGIKVRSFVRVGAFARSGFFILKIERLIESASGTSISIAVNARGELYGGNGPQPPFVLSKFDQRGNRLFTTSRAYLGKDATAVNYGKQSLPLLVIPGQTVRVKDFSHDLVTAHLGFMVIPKYFLG